MSEKIGAGYVLTYPKVVISPPLATDMMTVEIIKGRSLMPAWTAESPWMAWKYKAARNVSLLVRS